MKTRAPLVTGMLLALLAPHALRAQTTDPLPAPIDKKGLTVQIRDVVRLPKTLGMFHPDQDVNPAGWARVSFVHDAPDGRRFANDQRGYLYLLNEGRIAVDLCGLHLRLPAHGLQQATERLHRLRFPSGIRP